MGGQLVRAASATHLGAFCAANLAAVAWLGVGLATKAAFLGGGLTATEHQQLTNVSALQGGGVAAECGAYAAAWTAQACAGGRPAAACSSLPTPRRHPRPACSGCCALC